MIRGLYSGAAGMLSAGLREGVVADNLANSETPGFKAKTAALAAFAPLLVGAAQPLALTLAGGGGSAWTPLGAVDSGAIVDVTAINWAPGQVVASDSPLAAAISGPGFFGVSTPQGTQFTRAGDFRLDATGTVVTTAGHQVLGVDGRPLQVPPGLTVAGAAQSIDAAGVVRVGATTLGQLAVFQPPLNALTPTGAALYALAPGAAAPTATAGSVQGGFLERSNVDVVGQMAALLQIEQAFASDQQAVKTADQTANVAITQIGTVM